MHLLFWCNGHFFFFSLPFPSVSSSHVFLVLFSVFASSSCFLSLFCFYSLFLFILPVFIFLFSCFFLCYLIFFLLFIFFILIHLFPPSLFLKCCSPSFFPAFISSCSFLCSFQFSQKLPFTLPFFPFVSFPHIPSPPSFFSTSSLHLCSAEGCRGASTVNYPASITSTYSATPFHTPSSASRGTHTLTHTEWKRYGEHKRSCKFCLTLVLKCFFPLFHMFSQPICAAVQRTVATNSGRHLPSFLA